MIRLTLTALAFATSAGASAHSFWLEPETHVPQAGEEVAVEFKVGDIGKPADDWGLYWERIAALRVFGPDGMSDQQKAVRTTTAELAGGATITVQRNGTHILAFASNPSFSDFAAERFNRYLDHQGLTAIKADRAARGAEGTNGTELYARRAKTLLQIGERPTANVTTPIGQTLEIVPLANPFTYSGAGPLRVRVLWRGQPLLGASLMVARGGGEKGKEEVTLTNREGVAQFDYDPASRYLLSVVWGEPAPNDKRADYFTIFSSLTF